MPLYLYGLVPADRTASRPADAPQDAPPVQQVQHEGLTALVSEVPAEEDAPAAEAARTHHGAVLQAWLPAGPVLPAPPNTVFPDAEALRSQLLAEQASALHDLIARLRGTVEVEIAALWRAEALLETVPDTEKQRQALARALQQEGDAPSEGLELDRELAAALQAHNEAAAERILDRLVQHTEDHAVADPTPGRVLLAAAFLVREQHLDDFDAALEALDVAFADRILFRYAGPQPPYHFVRLEA